MASKATAPQNGKLLYHMTRLENMPSILQHGLLSRRILLERGYTFADSANQEILVKRDLLNSPLSQYVPFHFYAKNPFDGKVCEIFGSENMVIITIRRSLHERSNFYIIPTHPLDRSNPSIYPYDEGFNMIDWPTLNRASNRDYHNDEIRKKCMAECLVPDMVQTEDFFLVYTPSHKSAQEIRNMKYYRRLERQPEVNPKMFR